MTSKSLVSVIVPTKDSEATIGKCLKSIRNQTYPNIQITIVDSFSRDETKKIAEGWGAKIIETGAKRSKARNIGAKKSQGPLVFFVDSDMEIASSVINECVNRIGEGCDGVIIPEVSVGDGFWAKCKALEKTCYIGDDLIEAARFFRRSIFESIGGYDQKLEAGEDWDLNLRISKAGYQTGRINGFIRHYEGRLSLRTTMIKKHYYGNSMKRYRMKHPKEAKQQLRLIRPAFIRNWRKLSKNPVLALGLLLMKTCEFAAGGIGLFEK